MTMKSYWWKGIPNFGDLLGPILLKYFADIDTQWSSLNESEIISVGSILDGLNPSWDGIIAGSGKLMSGSRVDFPNAKIFGLRGPLSAAGVAGDFVLGDPALLANELVMAPKLFDLGIVPHWSDKELEFRPEFLKYNPIIIRTDQPPLDVVTQIGNCRKIVASSLHGLIVADSFNIPRRFESTPRLMQEGGYFKFRDHNATVGLPFEIGVTQEAPRYKVTDVQQDLFDMFTAVGDYVRLGR